MSNSYPDVSFTLLRSNTTPLTKSYSLKNGNLEKLGLGVLSNGTAKRIDINLSDLTELFSELNVNQAISHGSFGKESAQITTKSRADGVTSIARSTNYFSYEAGEPALILLDHDQDPNSPSVNSPQELLAKIEKIIPEIKDAAWVSKPSASAGIVDSDGNELTKDSGVHIYLVAMDGSDIPRFLRVLYQRLIMGGDGYPYITTTGTILVRTVIDKAVASPERIDFVAPANLSDGLSRSEIQTHSSPGSMLDTSLLSSLSPDETRRFDEICQEIKHERESEARTVREAYIASRAQETGRHTRDIRNQLELADNGALAEDHILLADDGTEIAVKGLLSDPNRWDGETFHDPLEPEQGSNKAKVYFNDNGSIILHSFIHGGGNYTLRSPSFEDSLEDALLWVDSASQNEVMKGWTTRTAHLNRKNHTQMITRVHKRAPDDVTKEELKDELKTHLRDRKELALSNEIEENETTRIDWIPQHLDAIVESVTSILSQEEGDRTLYDHGGSLVQNRVSQPNPMDTQNSGVPKTLLFPMTKSVLTARLLESFTFISHTDRGPKKIISPPPIVRYLVDAPFGLKPLKAIQSWPTVTPTGHLLHQQGYDPQTELYVTYSPELLDHYPHSPTHKDATASLEWLRDELLADFPFREDSDRDGVIAALLTAMMIRLLPAAPGFLFLAPIQASGKTTLIEIIFRAVFGIAAGASRWHDREEEMGKFILSMLREGYPGIVFDNITANSTIDSAEVAKLITGEEYQNRILGVSETARLPANVLVTASGNQVSVAGDLISRLLPIQLAPDVEDPSRRAFKRQDIHGWIDEHRGEILSHLLTLLTAYYSAKPERSHKPTRFPVWDRSVRTALIWAGGEDPADLFNHNKAEDLEGQAIATLIPSLHDHFGESTFMTKEITKIMKMSREQQSPAVVDTQPIFDSITELLDGEQPNSRSISKIIRGINGRVIGSLKFVKSTSKGAGGVSKYRVIKLIKEVRAA